MVLVMGVRYSSSDGPLRAAARENEPAIDSHARDSGHSTRRIFLVEFRRVPGRKRDRLDLPVGLERPAVVAATEVPGVAVGFVADDRTAMATAVEEHVDFRRPHDAIPRRAAARSTSSGSHPRLGLGTRVRHKSTHARRCAPSPCRRSPHRDRLCDAPGRVPRARVRQSSSIPFPSPKIGRGW